MAPWITAGAAGFGLGSALYKPGASAEQVGVAARDFIANWRAAMAGQPA
jgi:2-dehydro-3-deoxyphosphogalactonate aldolase